ncbi:GDSL-type esterase/lipase family protein [Priestia megaterium]|uniref:GDSL-type esterase/lipase family protein n=1 Tax=Priestia megaterium TaxID=1404 RepID=UPI000BFB4B57|nr:GDSL-type esterase/lipase family protein [Priestia megaterium]PGQ88283.1 hypothetical protein COA18_04970 [Priestia megaterium]
MARGITKPSKGGDASKKSITSTASKWWSQAVDIITSKVGTEERKVKTLPLSYKKRIVLFGSSSTEGTGPTSIDKFYGKILESRMASKGYEFYYRGVGGDNTPGAIARFYKDIAPIDADFVMLAFTIGNEGIYTATDKVAIYNQFKKNMLQLCHMVKQQGAVPIVFTQAPTNSYTAEYYAYAQKLQSEFETMGIHCVDWGGVLDDQTGKPIAGISPDGIHYNDAAHVEIANCIPPTLFEVAPFQQGGYLPTPEGYINTGALTTSSPISHVPTNLTTFTASMRFRVPTIALAGVMSFNSVDRLVLNTNGSLTIYTTTTGTVETIVPSGFFVANMWYTVTVTYSLLARTVKVYIDGVLKYTKTGIDLTVSKWGVGGRDTSSATLKNADIADVVLYRTRLKDSQVMALHEGTIPQTSLEIYSPMHDKVVAPKTYLTNLAPTNANLYIDGGETAITVGNPSV